MLKQKLTYFPASTSFANSDVKSRYVGVYFLAELTKKSLKASRFGIFV